MRYFVRRLAVAVAVVAVVSWLRSTGAIAQEVTPSPTATAAQAVEVVSIDPAALGDIFGVLAAMCGMIVLLLAALVISQLRR